MQGKKFCGSGTVLWDKQEIAQKAYVEDQLPEHLRIPRKVVEMDILTYLEGEPDDLLCLLACGIEDCILPGMDYKLKVEREIGRTLEPQAFFISSHSDLRPGGLIEKEFIFPRPSILALLTGYGFMEAELPMSYQRSFCQRSVTFFSLPVELQFLPS